MTREEKGPILVTVMTCEQSSTFLIVRSILSNIKTVGPNICSDRLILVYLFRHFEDFSSNECINSLQFCRLFKCSLDCQHVKASKGFFCEGGCFFFFSLRRAKKASVNHDGAEREELKLMKS